MIVVWTKLKGRHKKCIKPALWIASVGDEWLCDAKLGGPMNLRCTKTWRVGRGSDGNKMWTEVGPAAPCTPEVTAEFAETYAAMIVPRDEVLYWVTDSLPPVLAPAGCEVSAGYSVERVLGAVLEHYDVTRRP
jgi:hypothetical protein